MPYKDPEKAREWQRNDRLKHMEKYRKQSRERQRKRRAENPGIDLGPKNNENAKRWRENNPERYAANIRGWQKNNMDKVHGYARKIKLKTAYGMTLDDYAEMLGEQNGVCAICGRKPSESRSDLENLYIDHNHLTGKVRGLLCHHCNTGMGMFGDNADLLSKAISYLRERY